MKNMKKWLAVAAAAVMCLGLTACGGEFDAAGYTKAALDANYHAEYAQYAEYRDISEEEAIAEIEDAMAEQIELAFTGMDVTEESKANYIAKAKEVYALAKYEVGEAQKQDDGSFIVPITIEPADAFTISEDYVEEIVYEYIDAGKDTSDYNVVVEILIESLQRGIENNTYGAATTIEVTVAEEEANVYGISQSQMEALEAAMFPQ